MLWYSGEELPLNVDFDCASCKMTVITLLLRLTVDSLKNLLQFVVITMDKDLVRRTIKLTGKF